MGEVTGDHRFEFRSFSTGASPMNFAISDMFGSSPKTIMDDKTVVIDYTDLTYSSDKIESYLEQVLQLEAVACKDWLTNKVDRCVGGRVAKQQCAGPLQLPLNNVGVMALDFKGKEGVATSIGHSPISALVDPTAGSRNSIGEALSNIVWAPMKDGLKSVSLSANWMWACKNEGEDAKLYQAVQGCSDFAIELGINIPTGKDSLSMKQKYSDHEVIAPGTVIISAGGNCSDITKVVEPVLQRNGGAIYYLNLSKDAFKLGGSSFAQILNKVGKEVPTIIDAAYLKIAFNLVQDLIKRDKIKAGHDIGSGGLVTTLLEMCFADVNLGANYDLTDLGEKDFIKTLFNENIGLVFQADSVVESEFSNKGIRIHKIGEVTESNQVNVKSYEESLVLDIPNLRDIWFKTSFLLDRKQAKNGTAEVRYENYKNQILNYVFPIQHTGQRPNINLIEGEKRPKAAVIREKGSNSEREMANAMYLAGFDVKDVHMTDLISGRETLEDIQFIGAVGGFSNSDVLGSAKGWAGAFLYNDKANTALKRFFKRENTLSVGICNGCQLFMELEMISPDHEVHGKLIHNESHKHESIFTSVKVQKNNSVMLSTLEGATLGVWVSHGEGKFNLPYKESEYNIVGKYGYESYPANPNGSDYNTAMMCDASGRHLVMMPHIERSTFPWNWAYYPKDRTRDEVSPWLEGFVNAKNWVLAKNMK
ncbi:MAG: phosphoribosylformylglycinamidine synthase [Arcticibacterium sp.]